MNARIVTELFILGILDLMILFGNGLVMVAFILGPRRMRTFTNFFIINLAVADLLVGVLPLPFWMYFRVGEVTSSVKKIFTSFDVTFGCSSIFSLALISFERMSAVRYPTRHFNMTRKPVFVAIVLTWIVSGFVAVLSVLFGQSGIYIVFLFLLVFIAPTLLILICYIIIFRVAKRSASANDTKIRREVKTAKMISIIIGLFLFCWLPFFLVNIIYTHCTAWCSSIPSEVLWISKILHYANSMMNVWVYAACSPVFRNSFKAVIERKLNRKQSDSNSTYRSQQVRKTLTSMEMCSDDDTDPPIERGDSKTEKFLPKPAI